jgi:hypothetical protein
MRTLLVSKKGNNLETELKNEQNDQVLIPQPAKPSWTSLSNHEKAEGDFLIERQDVIE